MRELATAERVRRFLAALGRAASTEATCYLTGGATAVLLGWRESTIDIDLKLVPDADDALRAIRGLKDELSINVELAAPDDFIPVTAGWEERSPFETREGPLTVRHFDLYAQALAKLERAHPQDLADVEAMLDRRLIEAATLETYFDEIEPQLYRFPAIDPRAFRRRVEAALR